MTSASLELDDITVRFGDRTVLSRVSLAAPSGDIVALLGPSGSGKSTLLKVIAGIVRSDSGTVRIGGTDVTDEPTHRRHVGLVFQDNQLFPHRSVIDNVAFGLQMNGVDRRARHDRAAEWLERVGLGGLDARDVAALSGGEAKRVALARTMVTEPRVVLLDEPLTGLDRALHDRLAVDLREVLTTAGTTAVLVTHDHDEAAMVAVRSVELADLSDTTEAGIRIVELQATQTHDLRRRVLRSSARDAELAWEGDDVPTTLHLGLTVEGPDGNMVVAVSTWLRAPFAARPGRARLVQLRGMATEPSMQGRGLGAELLAAGVQRAEQDGMAVVWARARSTALAFYLANGFERVGDEFIDATTGLPHVIVACTFD